MNPHDLRHWNLNPARLPIPPRPQRFIHSLYVRPDRHRQGIGRALLDRALGRCGGHAALKCQEANRAACQFYLRLGWRPMDWGWSEAGPWIMFAY